MNKRAFNVLLYFFLLFIIISCNSLAETNTTTKVVLSEASGIDISSGEITLANMSETPSLSLRASVVPSSSNQSVTWQCECPGGVITVSQTGEVKLVKTITADTTATVTATSMDGESASLTINLVPFDAKLVPSSYAYAPSGTMMITSYRGSNDSFTTPETIKGITVTAIDDSAFEKDTVKYVKISKGVKSIGKSAFEKCEKLESVIVPNTVTHIGNYAFCLCGKITTINIPDGVTEIGNYVFYYCSNLSSIIIPNSVTRIGEYAFNKCVKISSISIPSSVKRIETHAFQHCEGLTSVTLSSGLTYIGDYAFYYCEYLNGINIPNGVTSISDGTFQKCTRLKNATIPNSVNNIGDNAFDSCSNLTSITIPNGVTSIGQSAFDSCIKLASAIIPSSVTSIGNKAFDSCAKDITIYGEAGSFAETYAEQYSINFEEINITTYPVAYDANGGTGAPAGQTKTHGTTLTLSSTKPTRSNSSAGSYTVTLNANGGNVSQSSLTAARTTSYSFKNWNTAANGSGTSYASGASYTANAAATLYAQWNSRTTTAAVTLPTPTRDGYGFKGWGTSASATSGSTGSYTPTSNVTLYAVWEKGTYTIAYDANGGTGAPAGQTKTHGTTLTLSTTKPTRSNSSAGSYTVTLNANSGSVSQSKLTATRTTSYSFKNWNTAANGSGTSYASGASYTANAAATLYAQWNSSTTTAAVTLPTPTRDGYGFKGWGTSASATSGSTGSYTPSGNVTLYAVWEKGTYYTVTYNANGGTGTPSSQTKEENVALTLSSIIPSKQYVIQYNANGGSVSPASKSVNCTFNNWNTAINGSGTSYTPGSKYTSNANVTLYAQWTNPTAGTLTIPTRSGYDFDGWFSSAKGGIRITDTSTITGNMTIFAHWTDPYNMGDETYSFPNYGDSDSPGGHCFGMSMTSAGYHIGTLNISKIGGNAKTPLYSFDDTNTVKAPICYYQGVQEYRVQANVAGGSWYLYGYNNIGSDWQEVVNYVRNHDYDNTGFLQIGFRGKYNYYSKVYSGGHAINFLRYEKVNGQDRIYAYDNNYPKQETYFYRDSSGNVRQAPVETFDVSIDCIALRDCRTYFNLAPGHDSTHVVYMSKEAATIQGYSYLIMEGALAGEEYVMFTIPKEQDRVIIIPKEDYADFIYMDTEYSFGEITDETYGVFKFATLNDGAVVVDADFQIFDASTDKPAEISLVYNQTSQKLVTAGTVEGGTLYYALGKSATEPPTDGWSEDIPEGSAPGTYYVWYKVVGDDNHNDVPPACIVVTITEPEQAAEEPSAPAAVETSTPTAVAPAPAPVQPAITIPKTPASVKAKAAKKGMVKVSWKKIKKTKKTKVLLAQINGVEVQYSTDPNFIVDVNTKNVGKSKTKVTLKLQKKTVYYIRVRYTDGAGGVSNWSAVKKVKTKK